MSERRSTYVFERYEDFEEAKDHLYHAMRSDYGDDDCLYIYGWWGDCYRIDIYSDCSDPALAASIIREHRGKYYSM